MPCPRIGMRWPASLDSCRGFSRRICSGKRLASWDFASEHHCFRLVGRLQRLAHRNARMIDSGQFSAIGLHSIRSDIANERV
jgi:hypothetical protein